MISLVNKPARLAFKLQKSEIREDIRMAKSIGFLNDFFISDKPTPYFKAMEINPKNEDVIFSNLESLSEIFYDDIDDLLEFYHKGIPERYKRNRRKFIETIIKLSRIISKENPYSEENWDS